MIVWAMGDIQIDPRMICAAIALGRSFLGLGTSSAICVTASGVPIVKAPFRTPAKKANPLGHPVLFAQSDHTNEFDYEHRRVSNFLNQDYLSANGVNSAMWGDLGSR
jgi:hypothetical protein